MPDMHQLTGAYALDALDDVERASFERHLRTCGSCAAEVIELQEAAAGLADRVAIAAPDGLRGKVLAEVSRTRQISPT
jgi:anti-sigma factor RsiW